ncbi:MAG: TetR-like C-terminal domain-containing protein [Roseiflexaceae bacterium]
MRVFLAQQHSVAAALGVRGLSFSLGMFRHAQSHLHRALVGKQSGAVMVQHMQQLITELVRDELTGRAPCDRAAPIPRAIVVHYTVSAFMRLLMWWADHDAPYTTAQMDAIFQQLTLPGCWLG